MPRRRVWAVCEVSSHQFVLHYIIVLLQTLWCYCTGPLYGSEPVPGLPTDVIVDEKVLLRINPLIFFHVFVEHRLLTEFVYYTRHTRNTGNMTNSKHYYLQRESE